MRPRQFFGLGFRHGRRAAVLLALGLILTMGAVRGTSSADLDEGENPHVWKSKTVSVAVFKNGLGFFMREGEVSLRDGWCIADEVPPAAFGTLAVYANEEDQTVDIVGSGPGETVEFDGHDAPADPAAKRARLEAALNLNVQLDYRYKGGDRTAAGKLVSVGPQFAVLESDQSSFAVPVEGVAKLQVLDHPLRIHVLKDGDRPAASSKLGMAYLRKGITWIPEYTLEVLDDRTARLTLRGTLVNEAEDLIHTDVHLVVGVPHFVHTDYMAPIAVGQVIRTIGSAVAGQAVPQQVRTQIMNRAAIVSNAMISPQAAEPQVVEVPAGGAGGDLQSALGDLPQLGGAAATDYTVYTKRDLTLRRGEKAILTLFTRTIPYGHIYRWNTPEAMNHSLVLGNETDTAWTTGPCLALSQERPLSEDLLKYTPKGAKGELPVTTAINIAHSKSEREIDRELKAYNPTHNEFYDLVTLEGTITLRNYEKRAVDVVITNPVPGKPTKAESDGRMSVNPEKLRLVEREGTIRWQVQLEPDEGVTLRYEYERYVRSN